MGPSSFNFQMKNLKFLVYVLFHKENVFEFTIILEIISI